MNITVVRRNALIDNLTAALNNGYIRAYNGTKPATGDTALSGNTLLAELRFGATAFPAASGGSAAANTITDDSAADASGTPSFCRLFASDGTTVVCDLTAAVGSGEVNFATALTAGNVVRITALTISIAA